MTLTIELPDPYRGLDNHIPMRLQRTWWVRSNFLVADPKGFENL